jgi:hypothetical protein
MPTETGPIIIQVADAVTNAATTILTLQHTTSGTPASGIGSLLAFQAQSLSGSAVVNADISGILTDVTSGAEKGALVLRTTTGGGLSERWRITDTGILQANGAQTIQTSTGALTLATGGGNGNIILLPNGSGNVGIGTTTPSANLQVVQTSNYPAAGISLTTSQQDPNLQLLNTSAAGRDYRIITAGTGSSVPGALRFYDATTGADRLLIDSTGNIGVGTSSPDQKVTIMGEALDVERADGGSGERAYMQHPFYSQNGYRQAVFSGNLYWSQVDQLWHYLHSGSNGFNALIVDYGGMKFYTGASTGDVGGTVTDSTLNSTYLRMVLATSGDLGIGTSNPTANLQIVQTANYPAVGVSLTSSVQDPNLQLFNTSGAGRDYRIITSGTGSGVPGALRFYDATAGADRLTIASNGNVGIGTTTPGNILDVNAGVPGRFWNGTNGYKNSIEGGSVILRDISTGNDYWWIGLRPYSSTNPGIDFLGGAQTPAGARATFWTNVGIGTGTPIYGAHVLQNNSTGVDLLGLENSSAASVTTKFAGIALRGTSTASASKDAVYLRAYPDGVDYSSTHLSFWTRTSDIMTEYWQITSLGVLQAMGGPQTIQTNTGALTLATGGGNGNIILSPQGTGMVTLGEPAPTNYFHVSNSACGGIDLIAIENSSSGNCVTKFAGCAMRGRDTSGNRMDTGYLRCFPGAADYSTSRLSFWSRFSSSAMVERMGLGALKNVPTNNAALPLFNISLAAGQTTGGMVAATIEVSDGTNYQAMTQIITFAAVNVGGSYTTPVTVNGSNSTNAFSIGSLSASWALTSGTNQVTMQVTPNSSLTSYSFYRVTFTVFNHSPQALTFL